MFNWFKKHFVPHVGNDHQPHFLRDRNIRNLVVIVFAIELIVLLIPSVPILNPSSNGFTAAVLPSVLDDLTNQNRQAQHLAVLSVNPLLNKVAELKAADMAGKGYFAHVSPDGKAPWYWFKQVGYNYEYAGENLAVDFTDSQDVTRAWIDSPTHRANIMKNAYTEIGTGVATGTYQGRQTIFVAQEFGKPFRVNNSVVTASAVFAGTNVFEKYLTSPRHIANIVFVIIGLLLLVAILLKLFIKMNKKHSRLITNGLIVLVIIFGIYIINNLMAKNRSLENTSFASFQNDQFN